MNALEPTGPNAEQIKYWNETAGPKWTVLQERIDAHIGPLGDLALDRAAAVPGERALDVGCGCGTTSIALARRVGNGGHVTGIDISTVMLDRARAAARAAALSHLTFQNADAQTHAFEAPSFDLLFSRFGVMFFADADAAFTNLLRALRPGGRVTFVCWRPLPENPWMFVPLMAAAQHISLPPPPAPDAPGPFSFGDAERVSGILTKAGFKDIELENVDRDLTVAGTTDLDSAVDFLLQMGPTGALIRDAAAGTLPRVTAAIREALVPYHGPQGVRMPAAARIVRARK